MGDTCYTCGSVVDPDDPEIKLVPILNYTPVRKVEWKYQCAWCYGSGKGYKTPEPTLKDEDIPW